MNERTGRRATARRARAILTLLVCLGVGSAQLASGQTAYSPYAPAGSQTSASGGGGYGTSTTATPYPGAVGSGVDSTASAYGAGSSGVSTGNPYGATGSTTVLQGSGYFDTSGGDFNPTTLPDDQGLSNPLTQAQRPQQVLRPTDGSSPGPLYARPSATPGQFELFRRPPPALSGFETFVQQTLGQPLARFGSSLVLTRAQGFATSPNTTVPVDYRLNAGDELLISVTGSVEARLRLVIDNEGRIFIPRVGEIRVAGLRYGDLSDALSRRFSEQFKQARVSVVVSRLHGITVYVTGYAVSPGAYVVSSLSTMVDAVLSAGGPAAGGSFRSIQLMRNGKLVSTLDLYDLLLKGDKSHDEVLQNNDVLNVGSVGPEVAVAGSVNQAAIFEAKPGESIGDIVGYAGGLSSLADDRRLVVQRLKDLDAAGSRQLSIDEARTFPAERGDIVRILSIAPIARPLERQAVLATIEGEVDRPGRYFLKPGATLADLLAEAGGLTSGAFVYGTKLQRDTVRIQQQESFDKAIENLELQAVAAPFTGLSTSATSGIARGQAALAVVERLKTLKPDGRVVLALAPTSVALPTNTGLENNDRIFIPPVPKTVGVFGATYQAGSFSYVSNLRIGQYLSLAGGPQRLADRKEIFVVRASGAVVSTREDHGLLSRYAVPGDVIFVPVRTSPSALDRLVEIASIVYSFGIGALTLRAIGT